MLHAGPQGVSARVSLLLSSSNCEKRYSPRNDQLLPSQPSWVSMPAPTNQPSRSLSNERPTSVPPTVIETSPSTEI